MINEVKSSIECTFNDFAQETPFEIVMDPSDQVGTRPVNVMTAQTILSMALNQTYMEMAAGNFSGVAAWGNSFMPLENMWLDGLSNA